ncbi:MAG: N-formylglutamate amidohydrolase [Rhodobacteraceae bacterium]|nr:N-formylglutamate amidohydrolase [Paracoccaceae bacterium]
MINLPYTLRLPESQKSLCIFSSPHSGRAYAETFKNDYQIEFLKLRSSEDAFVDQLLSQVVDYGAQLLSANVPRAFVDLNRSDDELDPDLILGLPNKFKNKRISSGLGVIPRVVANGTVIRRGKISIHEANKRLKYYYYPYHDKLSEILRKTKEIFGRVILYDCHSMPHDAVKSLCTSWGKIPDIVLSDCYGKATDRELLEQTENAFKEQGFHVSINQPFSGGFITKNYGNPILKQDAIQIEINRSLYMNELKIAKADSFDDFKEVISKVIKELADIGRESTKLAAE